MSRVKPSTLTVFPRTHWVNGWFLRLCAVPIIAVDGTEHRGRWGRGTAVTVDVGAHDVSVGARYLSTRSVLGAEVTRIEVGAGEDVTVEARNGFLNHQPFVVSVVAGR